MMQINKIGSYATQQNARFNNTASNILTVKQLWDKKYSDLPTFKQRAVDHALSSAIAEFKHRNPSFKSYADVKKWLVQTQDVPMSSVKIDTTMQRQLDIEWVINVLNIFVATNVLPIQVYRPDQTKDDFLAWDGMHTLTLLWIIATQIYGEDIDKITIPIGINQSSLKHEMRVSFVTLNGQEGKKFLDAYDIYEQMVFGVRIDKSENPSWKIAEEKQQVVESHDLFITSKKFNNHNKAGAISRMQEINKLSVETLKHLCDYLVLVGAQYRPVEEKELVMMAYFFESCRLAKDVTVTSKMISDIVSVTNKYWSNDFTPTSIFWAKVRNAYDNWHHRINKDNDIVPYLKKEPVHGYPFLIKQFEKDLPNYVFPSNRSNSEFVPAVEDLF